MEMLGKQNCLLYFFSPVDCSSVFIFYHSSFRRRNWCLQLNKQIPNIRIAVISHVATEVILIHSETLFMDHTGHLADSGLTIIGESSPACDDSVNIVGKSLRWLWQTDTMYAARELNSFGELHKCNVIVMFWVEVLLMDNNCLDWSLQAWRLQKSSKSSSPFLRVSHAEKGKSAVSILQ